MKDQLPKSFFFLKKVKLLSLNNVRRNIDYHIISEAKKMEYKISDVNQIALGEACQRL